MHTGHDMMSTAQIDTLYGRQDTLRFFVNLTRWMRTVHELHLLPPAPGLQMYLSVPRTNPYKEGKRHALYCMSLPPTCHSRVRVQLELVYDWHLHDMPAVATHAGRHDVSPCDAIATRQKCHVLHGSTAGLPDGNVMLHETRVCKTVYVPTKHLAVLLHVYATLRRLHLRTVISCYAMKVRRAA
jgi:hypothetical protein